MRSTTRIIVSVFLAAGFSNAANAQRVVGQYIVNSRVISDVAVNQEVPGSAHVHTAPGTQPSVVQGESYPSYPAESYPDQGYASQGVVNESYPANGAVVGEDGVEYVDGGEVQVDGSGRIVRGGGRLQTLVHGGEQGPHIPKRYGQPDLFYNYYSNGQNRVNAEMYLAPGPVPAFVGNTWVPYQPFMPHNYLYAHKDRYHNHYDYGRGTNRTKATYSVSALQYAQTFKNFIRLPR